MNRVPVDFAEFTESIELGFVRILMDTVDRGTVFVFQSFGYGFVGCQHAFFNHLVAFVIFFRDDFDGFTLGIQQNAYFGEIQIQSSVCKTLAAEQGSKIPCVLQHAA